MEITIKPTVRKFVGEIKHYNNFLLYYTPDEYNSMMADKDL